MFIYTAKFSKKKAIIAVLILAAVLCGIIFLAGLRQNDSSSAADGAEAVTLSAVVKNNKQRVKFLESLGWEVSAEPIEQQDIIIPTDFGTVYDEYNALQLAQGFDLSDYCGCEAVRYTYTVTNHPKGDDSVVADIIVYRNQIIAGDVQSVALDGFMDGLKFPG